MKLPFEVWDVIDNKTLYESFLCKNCGGMRRSHKTNTLVLISDHTKSLYDDNWDYGCGLLRYVGEGQVGNQALKGQNKVLAESAINGVELHLFEVFVQGNYLYEGIVKLVGKPYLDTQIDRHGDNRKVWVFNLQIDPENIASMLNYLTQRHHWIDRLNLS